MNTRTEKDALGELELPAIAYYGIHTARSMQNFDVAGQIFPIELIHAALQLKRACALANHELGALDSKLSDSIETACVRILAGEFDDQFIIDVFQAGSGTSSNMNINEVIANVANEQLGGERGKYSPIHPNDHVNLGQSTNNIVPSSIRIAASHSSKCLLRSVHALAEEFSRKEKEFADVVKSGRTHLQDAVPITLGQEFGAYARAIVKAEQRIRKSGQMLLELGVGGNAVGTGVNTKPRFRASIIAHLNRICDTNFRVVDHGVEATQFLTDLADHSAAIRLLAGDLLKITNDLRLLSSGPNTGLAEIVLPAVEPGSSIMPGKINPSICEAANMACMHVMGNDHSIGIAAMAGQLELNTHMPLIGSRLMDSIDVMTRCCRMLKNKCVAGIEANQSVCRKNFNNSAGLATVLNPVLGYDKVSELVHESLATQRSVTELVLAEGLLKEDEIEELLRNSTCPSE